jgi:hypothetical protein
MLIGDVDLPDADVVWGSPKFMAAFVRLVKSRGGSYGLTYNPDSIVISYGKTEVSYPVEDFDWLSAALLVVNGPIN